MSRLASGEATDDGSALRAQRDFGRRHLAWIDQLLQRAERERPATFYRSLLALSARFVAADERFVQQASMGVL
jgi:TorA maturation chaperone TorD